MTWLDYVQAEQLPEDYQLLARIIGLDLTIKVAEQLKSVHLYLKSPDKLFLPAKTAYVLDRHKNAGPGDPFNHRRIALETGLSERHIYDIIADSYERAKQGNLFDKG